MERYRDLAFHVAVHVCHMQCVDAEEAEFTFATILLLLRSLPHLLAEDQISAAPASLSARMAAAAAASSILKCCSDYERDREFSAAVLATAITRDERARYAPYELMESLHSFEATVAFDGGLFSVVTENVVAASRGNIADASRLGVIGHETAQECTRVAFYLAFHALYDVYYLDPTLTSPAIAAVLSLAALSCARESGHAARIPFPDRDRCLVGTAAAVLERVASLGPRAQAAVGGVFLNAQRAEHFMTLQEHVEAAARSLRLALL